MKYCPSATCSYAVKYRRPLEYRNEIVACTECGAPLADQAPIFDVAPEKKAVSVASEQDAMSRLAFTVIAAVLIWIGMRTPLFGIETDQPMDSDILANFSLLGFGVVPFITGFVLVELVALLVPALRRRRIGSAQERAPLDRAAYVVGFVILLAQIAGMARFMVSDGLGLVSYPSQGAVVAQYLAAHLALLALVVAVSRRGLMNGFALVVLVQVLSSAVTFLVSLRESLSADVLAPGTALLILVVLVAVASAVFRISRASRPSGGPGPTVVPFPISGLLPLSVAAALVALPMTLANFFPAIGGLAGVLQSSFAISTAVTAFLIVDCTLLFGFLFFRPRVVGKHWARWVKDADELGAVVRARALLPRALLLAAAVAMMSPLSAVLNVPGLAPANGINGLVVEAIVAALLVLDLAAEWRARRTLGRGLVSVRPVQRMAEVEPVLYVLQRAGIPAFARSVSFRATLQFFGPYVPVEILVPPERADEARRLLDAA